MTALRSLAHALRMVRRNLRSYRLLSVTIILSFSLLLAYLVFTDSRHYNRYKEIFARDRRLVFSVSETDPWRDRVLREKAAALGDTRSVLFYWTEGLHLEIPGLVLDTGDRPVDFGPAQLLSLPGPIPELYDVTSADRYGVDPIPVTWLDGGEREFVSLGPDEIIVDEGLYAAVGETCGGVLRCVLRSGAERENRFEGTFRIVGTVPSDAPMEFAHGEGPMEGKAVVTGGWTPRLVVSASAADPAAFPELSRTSVIAFFSERPELAAKLVEAVDPNGTAIGVFRAQDLANETMKTENRTKALVCGAMLLILGINLYSCFENALSDRRFEIGVKRALGASAGSIVLQFLYESLCVMLVCILLSAALVTDLLVVYKYVVEHTPDAFGRTFGWTVYVSPYSLAMFAVCVAALTVVFSLIFAYRSTRVRIADQLKAE